MGGQKNGLEVTVETLPMKNEAISVYFGELQIRMTAKSIRMLQMARGRRTTYTKGNDLSR